MPPLYKSLCIMHLNSLPELCRALSSPQKGFVGLQTASCVHVQNTVHPGAFRVALSKQDSDTQRKQNAGARAEEDS